MRQNIWKKSLSFLTQTTVVLLSSWFFTACGSDDTSQNITMENTTEVLQTEKSKRKHTNQKIPLSKNITNYIIKNKEKTFNIFLSKKTLSIQNYEKTIIVLNLYSPDDIPSKIHMNSLKNLEKKNNHILVLNIPTSQQDKEIMNFSEDIYNNLNITQLPIGPLSVLYVQGKYSQSYEGLVPIEMLSHDIRSVKIKKVK